jgi:Lipocalin-like domain
MYRRSIFPVCAIAALSLLPATNGAAQGEQKSAKELIAGNWTLMIADHVRSDGNKVPGFGPLPKGTAKFEPNGHYSLEVMPNSGTENVFTSSGTYTLDDSGKMLTLRVEQSSDPSWRGKTKTANLRFVSGDHLGWTTPAPLVASADFTGTELIWSRSK